MRVSLYARTTELSLAVLQSSLLMHGGADHSFADLLGDIYRQNGIEFSSTGTDLSDNNPYRRPELVDPPLTSIGREQARALQPVRVSITNGFLNRLLCTINRHTSCTFQYTKDLNVELVVVSSMASDTDGDRRVRPPDRRRKPGMYGSQQLARTDHSSLPQSCVVGTAPIRAVRGTRRRARAWRCSHV